MSAAEYARLVQRAYAATTYDIGSKSAAARANTCLPGAKRVLAIPGTDNIACWLADLRAIVKQTPLGGVHEGFDDAIQEIIEDIISYTPDVLTGHSEGADLCLLAAGYLCLARKPPETVWAFEPARLCVDDVLTGILRAHSVDVHLTNHGKDVVPLVPRILHDWRHPWELTDFGEPAWVIPNVEDHYLNDQFIRDLDQAGL